MTRSHFQRWLRPTYMFTIVILLCGLVFGVAHRANGSSLAVLQAEETASADVLTATAAAPTETSIAEPTETPVETYPPSETATAVPPETPEPCAVCEPCLLTVDDVVGTPAGAAAASFAALAAPNLDQIADALLNNPPGSKAHNAALDQVNKLSSDQLAQLATIMNKKVNQDANKSINLLLTVAKCGPTSALGKAVIGPIKGLVDVITKLLADPNTVGGGNQLIKILTDPPFNLSAEDADKVKEAIRKKFNEKK